MLPRNLEPDIIETRFDATLPFCVPISSVSTAFTLPEIIPEVSNVRLLALTLPVIWPLINIVPVESIWPSIFISLEMKDGDILSL